MNDESNKTVPRPIAPLPPRKPMNEEQVAALLAAAGSRKHDRAYLDSWDEQVAEYRQKLREEAELEYAEEREK